MNLIAGTKELKYEHLHKLANKAQCDTLGVMMYRHNKKDNRILSSYMVNTNLIVETEDGLKWFINSNGGKGIL